MTGDHIPEAEKLPLRERMPEYLIVFGLGLAATAVLGALYALVSSGTFATGLGYSLVGLAVVMLLGGGLAGGGFADLGAGAMGALLGSSRSSDGTPTGPDPRERLRRGLRPEANPRAFWQVVGGFAYFAIGTWIVLRFAS